VHSSSLTHGIGPVVLLLLSLPLPLLSSVSVVPPLLDPLEDVLELDEEPPVSMSGLVSSPQARAGNDASSMRRSGFMVVGAVEGHCGTSAPA
jgi:hypothetical protein